MEKHRYGLVGTGSRARMYVDAMLGSHADVAELLAIADVNPGRMRFHTENIEAAGGAAPAAYSPADLEEMIAEHRLDRIIITSPDHTHGIRSVAVGIAGNVSLASGAAVIVDDLGLGIDLGRDPETVRA